MKKNKNLHQDNIFIFDKDKNKVLKNVPLNIKGREEYITLIPNNVNKFKSIDKKFIFEKTKDNKGNVFFKRIKIIPLKSPTKKAAANYLSPSKTIKKKKECISKNKLYDPTIDDCVEDTTYNRILIKNKLKTIKNKSREKTPPLFKRKATTIVSDLGILEEETFDDSEPCIKKSKIILREHQLKAVKRLLIKDVRGLIASFGVGTGKTLTAVASAECMLDKGVVTKVVVASPKSLLNNFKKELIKYYYGSDAVVENVPESIFSNYKFITHNGIKNTFLELKNDVSLKNFLLIVDEAHEMRTILNYKKDDQTTLSSYFLELSLLAKKVLLLTATPFINNKNDLINLINSVKGGIPYHIEEYPNNEREKNIFLKNTFMFFELPEIDKSKAGMPSKDIFIKKFIMSPKYYNEYMRVERGMNINWENPEVFLSGLRQVTNALEGNPKIEWVVDHIIQNPSNKILVYSNYLESGVKLIQASLKTREIPFVEITGSSPLEERLKAVKDYNENKTRIFFITRAGGSGLDLKETNDVILFESNWNNSQEEQVIGRAVRIGSHVNVPLDKRVVNIYKLILAKPGIKTENKKQLFKEKKLNKGSADEIILHILEEKLIKEIEIIKELKEYSYE